MLGYNKVQSGIHTVGHLLVKLWNGDYKPTTMSDAEGCQSQNE